ncbi:MAG: hypothetical protein OSJ74_08600 [Clostridia bacterium]|nr:hypothetical protein [Clostridia bacterium]
MKRIKEKTVNKMLKAFKFFKKYGGLIGTAIGLLVGVIRFFVCKNLQCAVGYFLYASIIMALLTTVTQLILKAIVKRQISEHYKESIVADMDEQAKKMLGLNVEDATENKTDKEV